MIASVEGRIRAAKSNEKPKKPYAGVPLFPHANGQWMTKIRGRLPFFGPWADPFAALRRYTEERDGLFAARAAPVGRHASDKAANATSPHASLLKTATTSSAR